MQNSTNITEYNLISEQLWNTPFVDDEEDLDELLLQELEWIEEDFVFEMSRIVETDRELEEQIVLDMIGIGEEDLHSHLLRTWSNQDYMG